jgi:hypothetical protein
MAGFTYRYRTVQSIQVGEQIRRYGVVREKNVVNADLVQLVFDDGTKASFTPGFKLQVMVFSLS